MIDLEGLWRDAKAGTPVCAVTGTTKNAVLNAITEGARTLEDIEKTVPLCGGECALRNVSGCNLRPRLRDDDRRRRLPSRQTSAEAGRLHRRAHRKMRRLHRLRRVAAFSRKAKISAPRGIFLLFTKHYRGAPRSRRGVSAA